MCTKVCSSCGNIKHMSLFYNRKASKDGKSYRCISCDITAGKAYRKKHKERVRVSRKWERLKRIYGLTEKEYKTLWESQKGLCPICGKKLDDSMSNKHNRHKAVVDHDHSTGKVRGLLCTTCNKGLGLLGDNSSNIKKALRYLGE